MEIFISAICAIGSFIGFILAQKEKKEAKKYAQNANKFYLEGKDFYEQGKLHTELELIVTIKEKIKAHIRRSRNHALEFSYDDFQKLFHANIAFTLLRKACAELCDERILECINPEKNGTNETIFKIRQREFFA